MLTTAAAAQRLLLGREINPFFFSSFAIHILLPGFAVEARLNLSSGAAARSDPLMEPFTLPFFYSYPPYFTLQPVRDTREKQVQLWKDLIVKYCKTYKIFVVNLDEEFPLFVNSSIDRKLSHEARELLLGALVSEGKAEWLDKGHRKCLILWRTLTEWANVLLDFVKENGFEEGVMTIEEIQSGDETRGTDLAGMDRVVLVRAIKLLENWGKAVMFKGSAADDEGVKFSA